MSHESRPQAKDTETAEHVQREEARWQCTWIYTLEAVRAQVTGALNRSTYTR